MFFRATLILSIITVFLSCKPKEPSVLKVFVRSNNFILTEGASVRIVGDLSTGTPEYFEETLSDESGVAYFFLDEYFETFEKDQDKVANFTLYARDSSTTYTIGEAKARANLLSTASITLDE